MENTLNQEKLLQYARNWSKAACDAFFSDHKKINGNDIKNFSTIKQVNFFVIQELMLKWHEETEKIRSPYFNFEHHEVREALTSFMNVLSRHIEMKREVFEGILVQSIRDTITILFAPFDYFVEQIGASGTFQPDLFRKKSKYIVINKNLAQVFLKKLEENKVSDKKEAFNLFENACAEVNAMPEDPANTVAELKKTLDFDFDSLFLHQRKAIEDNQPSVTPRQNEPIPDIKVSHRYEKIQSISASITLNQRYMFQKELFDDNPETYEEVISKIDEMASYSEVARFLSPYMERFNWDIEKDEEAEFFELISRKFNG